MGILIKERLLIGQYYPVDSPIHRLNAKCKLLATLVYMIAIFVVNNWWGWGALAVLAIAAVIISHVPFKAVWRGLKVILFFAVVTFLLNVFVYPGETIWSWGFLSVSLEGIIYGLAMGLRLLLLVLFASLLTLTTTPIDLTDGLEGLLSPFRRIGVPAHEIAMVMSIALRFIPTILEEFDRIILAQRARGAAITKGNIFKRMKALIPMLIPLFVSAFRRAEDMADAMEAKCYRGGAGRTKWKVASWRSCDTVVLIFFVLFFAGSIISRAI